MNIIFSLLVVFLLHWGHAEPVITVNVGCRCGSWSVRVLDQLPPGTGRCIHQDHIKGARDSSNCPVREVTQFWSLAEVSCGAEMGSFSCSYQEHVWFV